MQLGMTGLGRMGANLTRRLMRDGLEVVVVGVNADFARQLEREKAVGARSPEEFVAGLGARDEFGGHVEKATAGAR